MTSFTRILSAGVCAAGLAACSTTALPTLKTGDVPGAFEQKASANAPIWPASDWWRGFGSVELDAIIGETQSNNLDMAAAEARVLQADARARQAGATLLPSVNFSANGNQQAKFGSLSLGASASYEFDFWGRNRDLLNAALAAGKASRADSETVALTAITGAADTYFQLLSLRERLAIAQLNLENAQSVLTLTEARVRDGIATPLDLAQQRAAVAGLQAAIPQLQQQELAARDALAVLLGRPPEGFDVATRDLEQLALPDVTPGLPSELLVRRPDVVSAEANLESAHANVAAARAAFLPTISLTGSGGLSSTSLSGLVINPVESVSLGASLLQTVFDAGRLDALSDEAKATELQLLATYRSAAVNAFSETETALGSIGHLAEQESYQAEQERQSEQAFAIAQTRYREGVADFLTVLDAQRTLYSARDQLNQLKLARLQAIVALYKALGGGWQDTTPSVLTQK